MYVNRSGKEAMTANIMILGKINTMDVVKPFVKSSLPKYTGW